LAAPVRRGSALWSRSLRPKTARLYASERTGAKRKPSRSQNFHSSKHPNCAKLGDPGSACARLAPVKRAVALFLAAWSTLLVGAPVALAANGVGLAGPITDKTVTFFCFGVIIFFAVLVIVMSLIQGRLQKRKERRRYDLERYG
jgi:hypothetical protein